MNFVQLFILCFEGDKQFCLFCEHRGATSMGEFLPELSLWQMYFFFLGTWRKNGHENWQCFETDGSSYTSVVKFSFKQLCLWKAFRNCWEDCEISETPQARCLHLFNGEYQESEQSKWNFVLHCAVKASSHIPLISFLTFIFNFPSPFVWVWWELQWYHKYHVRLHGFQSPGAKGRDSGCSFGGRRSLRGVGWRTSAATFIRNVLGSKSWGQKNGHGTRPSLATFQAEFCWPPFSQEILLLDLPGRPEFHIFTIFPKGPTWCKHATSWKLKRRKFVSIFIFLQVFALSFLGLVCTCTKAIEHNFHAEWSRCF